MQHLLEKIPTLKEERFQVTSPQTELYNCIAWAASDNTRWWEPSEDTYWPPGVPLELTVEAFMAAYSTLSYVQCESEELEYGYEKIAIYANSLGRPKHAARQLPNGRWTSKCGDWEDIEHELHDIEGAFYGRVTRIMKRPITP